jgi:UDP-glucose 4-epimerase
MRTLVTGGAGFIGSTLTDRLLAEGHKVDVVDDLSSGSLANLAEARSAPDHAMSFFHMDIRSPDLVELMARRRPEVVFHLAAQPSVRVSTDRPVFDAATNILGTLRTLEGALAGGSSRVVYAASGGTLYGDPAGSSLPVKESHPQRPISPYGVSKKAGMDYLAAYRALHGLEFCALALANVYGPRQDPHGESGVIAIFAEQLAARRRSTIYGDGSQTRDFVYVDDVVDAFVRAAERGGGMLLNVGTGVETSVNRLYGMMARIAGYDGAPLHAAPRAGDLQRSAVDPSRAAVRLGWRPWTTLEDGLRAVLAFFARSEA